MYREPSQLSPRERPPNELIYDVAYERDQNESTKPRVAAIIGAFVMFGTAVTVFPFTPVIGSLTFAGLCTGSAWWWRSRPGTTKVLRIDDGELSILPRQQRSTGAPLASIRLVDIVDVTLDSAPQEWVEGGTSARTALKTNDHRQARDGGVSHTRVVFVPREGRPIFLGDTPLPHSEATEWLGKVRVFLRKNDWLPDDERAVPSTDGQSDGET